MYNIKDYRMSNHKNKDPDSGEYVKRSAGRPRLSEGSVRTIVKKFRVNPMEDLNIQTNFEKSQKKKESDYLRDMSQYGYVFAIASPEELQLGREYTGALNNLSQFIAMGHKYGMSKFIEDQVMEVVSLLKTGLEKLYHPHRFIKREELEGVPIVEPNEGGIIS